MRDAEVWRTLKPFQPALMNGPAAASAAPCPPAASAPGADDHHRALGLGDRVGQLAEQLEIVAEPFDRIGQIDLGPDAEHLGPAPHRLAQPRVDQRRFPARVGADQQDRVGIVEIGQRRVEPHRAEADVTS